MNPKGVQCNQNEKLSDQEVGLACSGDRRGWGVRGRREGEEKEEGKGKGEGKRKRKKGSGERKEKEKGKG